MRNIWKHEEDPSRCDWAMRQVAPVSPLVAVTDPTPTLVPSPPLNVVPQIVTATQMKLYDLARARTKSAGRHTLSQCMKFPWVLIPKI